MHKSPDKFGHQEHSPEEAHKTELFRNLTNDAQNELSKLSSSAELWQVKADLVKAMALSGDLESAKREADSIPLNK